VACEKLFVRVERETDMVVAVSFVLNVESVHWGSWTMGWTCGLVLLGLGVVSVDGGVG
jgi:hypothetical protein